MSSSPDVFPPPSHPTASSLPAMNPTTFKQHEDIWQAVLGELELSLPRSVFDAWLRDARIAGFENGCYIIAVKNSFAQEWLEKRMKGMIKSRLTRMNGHAVDVTFVVRPESVPETPPSPASPLLAETQTASPSPVRPIASPHTGSNLRPNMTFATFVEGDGNRFACAAAQAVAAEPGLRYNPLFIYGGVGLGKTHLLHAIGHQSTAAGYVVRYVTAETFTNDMIEAIRNKANAQFRQLYRDVDVLLIDDIQFIQGKESTQNEFFHTFNSLQAANKQIVVTSDRAPHLLTKLEDRITSRFAGGLMVDVQPPSFEHRLAILRNKAQELGVTVPPDVLQFIAEHYAANVRELQGALTRVAAYAQHFFAPIDMALAQQILVRQEAPIDDSPEAILKAVADEFRVPVSELTGPRRARRVVVPRQAAMHLMREVTQLSFPQIGEILGGRDHTTVIYGTEKFQERLQKDPQLQKRLENVRVKLQA